MTAALEIATALKRARSASRKLHNRRPAGMPQPVAAYLVLDLDGAVARLEAAYDRITWNTSPRAQAGGPR